MELHFKINTEGTKEELHEAKASLDRMLSALLEGGETVPTKKAAPRKAATKKPAAKKEEEVVEMTFEELSSKVSEKIKKLKDAGKSAQPVVKKLKSFGVDKLDELDTEDYSVFLAYVEKL